MKFIFSIAILLLGCLSQGCITEKDPEGPSLQAGDPLPEFSVVLNTGKVVSTATLRGKVSVIVFFNTGCGDCRQELPVINNLWKAYEDDPDVEVLAIAREQSLQDITEYWAANDLSMPFSPQENRDIYTLFAPSVIPRIYVSNAECIIIKCYDDTDMPTLQTLEENISQAL